MDRREKYEGHWPPKNPFCLKIHVYNRQKILPIDKSSVRDVVGSVLDHMNADCDEIGIYFVSEKKICELHDQFFQDPSPTDCISFPIDQNHLGEVFVCPSTAICYAKKRGLDPYLETALYVVHGILHLLGFDDLEKNARRAMRKKEKSCMRHLSSLNLSIRPKQARSGA